MYRKITFMELRLLRMLFKPKEIFLGIALTLLFSGLMYGAEERVTIIDMDEFSNSLEANYLENNLKTNTNQERVISGTVTSADDNLGLPGVNVVVKGTTIGVSADFNGNYSLKVPSSKSILVFSYLGFITVEKQVSDKSEINILMRPDLNALDEVIVVGYGKQKKESLVGAIVQTDSKTLARTGGVSSLGAALTGNLSGVITIQGSGEPGAEDPQILIRGTSTWNNSSPLILVDGIERPMNTVDIGSVESISVLKDASATAVFGVKGANGVILITTKRGKEGKSSINVTLNTVAKVPSRLPDKYDSYDALRIRNLAIERELALNPASWEDYTPYAELDKYRNPSSLEEAERYPNINWVDESVEDYAMSYNGNINISGGTKFVKYYTSLDYLHEGDIMKIRENNKGYNPGYGYNRVNTRANLDFNLSNSTVLKVSLSGSHGTKKQTWSGFEYTIWQAAYALAPDVMLPVYSDGTWGYYPDKPVDVQNSTKIIANSGVMNLKTTQINTDFTLEQDLSLLTKGLSFTAKFALDNTFVSEGGIYDEAGNTNSKWISPEGEVLYDNVSGDSQYDYVLDPWTVREDELRNYSTYRKKYYEFRLNYNKSLGKHNIGFLGLFSRDETATGSEFINYREDWVFRTTYDYANKYLLEFNGSYNGSEKFSSDYRFEFFPSMAVGWVISKENFLKDVDWLNNFKVRGSYGLVGNDNIYGRWLYQTQWEYGSSTHLGTAGNNGSPYTWYKEAVIGNPDLHWETVEKKNLGVDFSFLKNKISGSVDVFEDHRTDILLAGSSRAIADYFGAVPPTGNLGEVKTKGYEIELKLNHTFSNELYVWSKFNMTHAKDNIIFSDDPELLPDYQKNAGYSIGQYTSTLSGDYYNTWDEVYGSTILDSFDNNKIPGNVNLIDFNADGVIDSYDSAPYGYSGSPQNTYSLSIGTEFKGFSAYVQFYGVNNVTRDLSQTSFNNALNTVFKQGEYWTADNTNGDLALPRWKTDIYNYGNLYNYDGSYLRLKTAEVAYTFRNKWTKKSGIQSLKVFLNGNNLIFWSDLPDDREANIGGATYSGQGGYPTVKRINLGLNISL